MSATVTTIRLRHGLVAGVLAVALAACNSALPPSTDSTPPPPTEQKLPAAQLQAQYQSQIDSLRKAFVEIAQKLPAHAPSKGPVKLDDSAPPHCGEVASNVTFVAEERLKDPTRDPEFQLGLAELCVGTNVIEFLRAPAADQTPAYDKPEVEAMLSVPYIVVMRTVRFLKPRITSKTTPEEQEAKALKGLDCTNKSPDECERTRQFLLLQLRGLSSTTPTQAILEDGSVVMDLILVDVKSRRALGATRVQVKNSPKSFGVEGRAKALDKRMDDVLFDDLRQNTAVASQKALEDAFRLFH